MMDILIALVLLGVGFWLGRRQNLPAPAPQPEQRELDRLREDRMLGAEGDDGLI